MRPALRRILFSGPRAYAADNVLRSHTDVTSNNSHSPFVTSASSVFNADDSFAGPWKAFDGDDGSTFWHSNGAPAQWINAAQWAESHSRRLDA